MMNRMVFGLIAVYFWNVFCGEPKILEKSDMLIAKKLKLMECRKETYDKVVYCLTEELVSYWITCDPRCKYDVQMILKNLNRKGEVGENDLPVIELKEIVHYDSPFVKKEIMDLLIHELTRASEIYVQIIKEDLEWFSQFPAQRDTINNALQKLGIKKGLEIKKSLIQCIERKKPLL